jgi:LacI family transcriptional regulator
VTTIRDVAAESGFGVGTVSRALNGDLGVRPETRELVLGAAQKLGYRRNGLARALRQRTSRTVGLMVPDLQNEFFMAGAQVAQDRLAEAGFGLIVGCHKDDRLVDTAILESLVDRHVDALLHAPCGNPATTELLRSNPGLVVVEFGRSSGRDDVDSVTGDDAAGAVAIVDHLAGLGHKRIALVTGPPALSTSAARLAGFRAGLRASGLHRRDCPIYQGPYTPAAAEDAAAQLLKEHPDVTAIFAASSRGASGVLRALRKLGISVPGGMSLAGFLNADWYDLVQPGLTCYRVPVAGMGTAAVSLLLGRIGGSDIGPPQHLVLRGELVVRQSTAPPREGPLQLGQSADGANDQGDVGRDPRSAETDAAALVTIATA